MLGPGTIRSCDPDGVGVSLLEKVCHWRKCVQFGKRPSWKKFVPGGWV